MRRHLTALLILMSATTAWGHPMPGSAVALRLHRAGIEAELLLPVGELALGWEKPLPADAAATVRDFGAELKGYVRDHVRPVAPDGRPWAVAVGDVAAADDAEPHVRVALTLTPPPAAPADRLTLRYDVILHHLVTHAAIVSIVGDWRHGILGDEPVLLGTLRDTEPELAIDRSGGSWFAGFAALFRHGAWHIADGTDHLLFLLALLLPAPLVAANGRWGGPAAPGAAVLRIAQLVSAFTVGHSITLAVGAAGLVRPPEAAVESAIALSILASAVHALVPVFRGREVYLAGSFGLVHGLAFASTLTAFGLDPWTMAGSILGFNLGIEAFQLAAILAAMPWLVLLARSPIYGPFRVAGAVATGVAAASWFAERALGWANPVGPVVEGVAARAPWLLAGLIALAAGAAVAGRVRAPGRQPGG